MIKAYDKAAKDSQTVVMYAFYPTLVSVRARPQQIGFIDRGKSLRVKGLKTDKDVSSAATLEPFQ